MAKFNSGRTGTDVRDGQVLVAHGLLHFGIVRLKPPQWRNAGLMGTPLTSQAQAGAAF